MLATIIGATTVASQKFRRNVVLLFNVRYAPLDIDKLHLKIGKLRLHHVGSLEQVADTNELVQFIHHSAIPANLRSQSFAAASLSRTVAPISGVRRAEIRSASRAKAWLPRFESAKIRKPKARPRARFNSSAAMRMAATSASRPAAKSAAASEA